MLVYRYAPAGSRVLPAWKACPATPVGLAGAVPASGPRLPAFRDGATCETRPVRLPSRSRTNLISPKSFLYHFAVKALLALI